MLDVEEARSFRQFTQSGGAIITGIEVRSLFGQMSSKAGEVGATVLIGRGRN